MYGNTPEAAEYRVEKNYQALQKHVGGCREWIEEKANCCFEPAEFVLWGKLIDEDGLGPRCYDHAAEHVGHDALRSRSGYALIDLADLAKDIDAEHFPDRVRS